MKRSQILDIAIVQAALARYMQLSDRDQLAVKSLTGFFAVLILFNSLITPAYQFQQQARHRMIDVATDYRWMQENRTRLPDAATRSSRDPETSLLSLAGRIAKQNKITFQRYESMSDGRLRLVIDNVPFKQLLSWLHVLETEFSVYVATISVQRDTDGALVSARVVLKG